MPLTFASVVTLSSSDGLMLVASPLSKLRNNNPQRPNAIICSEISLEIDADMVEEI